MSKFMSAETALARIVENDKAPVMARVRALEQLANPSLNMLRRLLAQTAERKANPLPGKLAALTALKYAAAIKAQNARRERRLMERKGSAIINAPSPKSGVPNALGI